MGKVTASVLLVLVLAAAAAPVMADSIAGHGVTMELDYQLLPNESNVYDIAVIATLTPDDNVLLSGAYVEIQVPPCNVQSVNVSVEPDPGAYPDIHVEFNPVDGVVRVTADNLEDGTLAVKMYGILNRDDGFTVRATYGWAGQNDNGQPEEWTLTKRVLTHRVYLPLMARGW